MKHGLLPLKGRRRKSKATAVPDVHDRIPESGAEPIPPSTEEFARTIVGRAESFKEITRVAGIQPLPWLRECHEHFGLARA
jgi:hypothetical protein